MTQAVAVTRKPADFSTKDLQGMSPQTGTQYEPISEGEHPARFVDVIDGGVETYMGKRRHRLLFILVTDERQPKTAQDPNPGPKVLTVRSTTSLFDGGPGTSPSAHMAMLRGISGRPQLSVEDLSDYSTGMLTREQKNGEPGVVCRVFVEHKQSVKGRTYARVVKFMRAKEGDAAKALPASEYTRPDWLHQQSVEGQAESAKAAFGDGLGTPDEDIVTPAQVANAAAPGAVSRPAETTETETADEPPPPTDNDNVPF